MAAEKGAANAQAQVQEQAELGKVGFGAVYNDGVPDVQQAVDTAILAFEDGL